MSSLQIDLLHSLALVESFVDFFNIFKSKSMGYHVERVDLSLLNEVHEMFPILVYWSLAISNQAYTGFHQGTDIEMISLQ